LELRFAEVSGFLSAVATTAACGNATTKDMSIKSTEEKSRIIRPEVLRLFFSAGVVFSLFEQVKEGQSCDLWSLWISERQTFLKYKVSIILPM
jgi:hypothetical protein